MICIISEPKYYMFFDTETTGLPKNFNAPSSDTDNWPRMVQLSWVMIKEDGSEFRGFRKGDFIIQPDGFTIPREASNLHGITTERAIREGRPLRYVLDKFNDDLRRAGTIVGHNVEFDIKVVGAEMIRLGREDLVSRKPFVCTMKQTVDFCEIPGKYGYKWPKLEELYYKLFNSGFSGAHNAMNDVMATVECFRELKKRGIID